MKAKNLIWACALVLGVVSCAKDPEIPAEEPAEQKDPVILTARIADETKATLSETDGTFAFSAGDQIKVFDGTAVYASTGVTIVDNYATFTMPGELNVVDGSGYAAFPASSVSAITGSGVTFTLPSSYTYDEVGGLEAGESPDASAAKVPCPMIASYTAGEDLFFKQAGAVVRFRITGCEAGSLTFTFTTPVTGSVTLASVPSGDNDGILAANLTNAGYSITVTGVPEAAYDFNVNPSKYIYITLPVPTGTDPLNVGVWNNGTSVNNVATLRNATPISLARAGGYKRGVTLRDVKNTATFNGLHLAGDLYYTGEYNYAVQDDPFEVLKYYSVNYTTSDNHGNATPPVYYFSWNFLNGREFKFNIGGINYRVPSSGNTGDWAKIADTTATNTRTGSIIKAQAAKYAYATVTGLNESEYHTSSVGGVIFFPDNAIIAAPSGAKLAIFNTNDKADNNTLTVSELTYLRNQGCSFLPTPGYWNKSEWYYLYWKQGWYGINEVGTYWSDSAYNSSNAYAITVLRNHATYSPRNIIDPRAVDEKSGIFYPVRLIRVVPMT